MTLALAPAMRPEDEAREGWDRFRLEQLSHILDTPAGEQRFAYAAELIAFLKALEPDLSALRDLEVARLLERGWGPAALSALVGLSKGRGGQIADRARDADVKALAVSRAAQIKREVVAARRRGRLGPT